MIQTPSPSHQARIHLQPGKVAFQLANQATQMIAEPLLGQATHNKISFTPNLITLYTQGLEIPDPEIVSITQEALRKRPDFIWMVPDLLDLLGFLRDPGWIKQEIDHAFEDVREVWHNAGAHTKESADKVVPQRLNITLEPRPFYSYRHWYAYWTLGLEIKLVLAVIMKRRQDENLRLYTFPFLIRQAFSNLFANHSRRLALDPMFEVYDWREIESRYAKLNNRSGG